MAIALVLIAVAALPRRAWWAAAPAIVLCSATAFTVDSSDLDVRAVNAFSAVGVVITGITALAAIAALAVAYGVVHHRHGGAGKTGGPGRTAVTH